MKGGIFISYRRTDSAGAAGRIRDRLTKELGDGRVFMDVADIAPGVDFEEAIARKVSSASAVIAIIGPSWGTDPRATGEIEIGTRPDYVRMEVSTALKAGVRVIPVLVDNAVMPAASDLPDSLKKLARLNALEIRHTKFESDVAELVDAVSDLKPRRRTIVLTMVALSIVTAGVILQQILFNNPTETSIDPSMWTVQMSSSAMAREVVNITIQSDNADQTATPALGPFDLAITGANPQRLEAVLDDNGGGYRASYTAVHAGSDTLTVMLDGELLPGGPFVTTVQPVIASTDTGSIGNQTTRVRPAGVEFNTRAPATYLVLDGNSVIASGQVSGPTWVRDIPARIQLTLRLTWNIAGCPDSIWEQRLTLQPGEERPIPTRFECSGE